VFRKDLMDMLLENAMSVADIARRLEMPPREVEDNVRHLLKSIRHQGYRAQVTPAQCRKCGFTFGQDKLRKPGKCPRCHATWLSEPKLSLVRGD
jgi:predicted Zn-ribbon and HTH transcriptional regulator